MPSTLDRELLQLLEFLGPCPKLRKWPLTLLELYVSIRSQEPRTEPGSSAKPCQSIPGGLSE
jgi:hypothetical protein